mmetsp:Transcript_46011/g.55797  ORF Transcript_46011/g.55797 Transcript_46011/m.55797 type:complete len:139 (-) Transcript_46011:184-600(-)
MLTSVKLTKGDCGGGGVTTLDCAALSPRTRRKKDESHKTTTTDNNWRLLPVHTSITYGAPLNLIRTLIASDPRSLTNRDDRGRVPLHLAFRRADEGIISEILEVCPDSFYAKDHDGLMPIQYSSKTKNGTPSSSSFGV